MWIDGYEGGDFYLEAGKDPKSTTLKSLGAKSCRWKGLVCAKAQWWAEYGTFSGQSSLQGKKGSKRGGWNPSVVKGGECGTWLWVLPMMLKLLSREDKVGEEEEKGNDGSYE